MTVAMKMEWRVDRDRQEQYVISDWVNANCLSLVSAPQRLLVDLETVLDHSQVCQQEVIKPSRASINQKTQPESLLQASSRARVTYFVTSFPLAG